MGAAHHMKTLFIGLAVILVFNPARAEDSAPSRIDSITKSARDMMPAMPAMPSVSLPSMPDLSLPDFSDASGRLMTEFNTFTQQVGDALPILDCAGGAAGVLVLKSASFRRDKRSTCSRGRCRPAGNGGLAGRALRPGSG